MDDKKAPDSGSVTEKGGLSDILGRRDLLRAAGLVGAGIAASVGSVVVSRTSVRQRDPAGEETVRKLPELTGVPPQEGEDILVRMQRELSRAMAKPMEKRRWSMVIDTRKCVGCHACTVSCIAENKLPPGVVYRPVVQQEFGTFPNVQLRFFPRPCMQCDNPPCVSVCPVNATWKRSDGVTAVNYDKCIGCRYCLTACPYGARTSDYGHEYTEGTPVSPEPYEELPNYEYGKAWNRAGHNSPMGNARKCQFCLHRLERGQLPECVTTCIGRANYFGDANDPTSLVSQMGRSANSIRLLEDKGTKPTVIYLI